MRSWSHGPRSGRPDLRHGIHVINHITAIKGRSDPRVFEEQFASNGP